MFIFWFLGVHDARVLVTDARRPSDVAACADTERQRRGWAHDPAVDEAPSETGLDDPTYHDREVRGDADDETHRLTAESLARDLA